MLGVRSGSPSSVLVRFDDGVPDAAINWQLLDAVTGTVLATGSSTIAAGAVSANLPISALNNTLADGQYVGYRDLVWNYTTGGTAVVNGESRYSVTARLPYGVSEDGVRAKLGGVTPVDLPDADIQLAKAFLVFREAAGADRLSAVTGDSNIVAIKDAIEALAGLSVNPSMVVRVASKESSGTNSYNRQAVDWSTISDYLSGLVTAGYLAVDPTFDETANDGPLFILATPSTDPVTGSAYTA